MLVLPTKTLKSLCIISANEAAIGAIRLANGG
jgi:hypothetical protein